MAVLLGLAWAALAPLLAVPGCLPLELVLWVGFFGALVLRALTVLRQRDTPGLATFHLAASAALGLHACLVLRGPSWLADETRTESLCRAVLNFSSLWHGWPVLALGYAWALFALGAEVSALLAQALALLAPSESERASRWHRVACIAALAWTLGFGSLAVLGYASGGPPFSLG